MPEESSRQIEYRHPGWRVEPPGYILAKLVSETQVRPHASEFSCEVRLEAWIT
ncbi:Hypothetical predicted protein [Pelobates cultripes]|uniref:Uncharacterized protein n=1 Tax=Pelobates cultripes TaxID=61616 RepID=A0AAD1TD65_PELCU|nr:Hypothetical predicted protein [Pelobates cultripes]